MERNKLNLDHALTEDEMEKKEMFTFSLEEFTPKVFDCEADGSCGSGHIHLTQKDR